MAPKSCTGKEVALDLLRNTTGAISDVVLQKYAASLEREETCISAVESQILTLKLLCAAHMRRDAVHKGVNPESMLASEITAEIALLTDQATSLAPYTDIYPESSQAFLELQLVFLSRLLAEHQFHLQCHYALFSPIRDLSRELLEQIFLATIRLGVLDNMAISMLVRTLTSVCRLWRTVALDLPQLWVYVTPGTLSSSQCAKWLQPSAPYSVWVNMYRVAVTRGLSTLKLYPAPDMNFPTGARIWRLDLYCKTSACWELLVILPRDMFPALQILTLVVYNRVLTEVKTFEASTRLTCLRIRDTSFNSLRGPGPLPFRFHWSSIATLDLHAANFDYMDLLTKCTGVVDCRLVVTPHAPDRVPPPRLLHLPALRRLTLELVPRALADFMEYATCPALETLCVTGARPGLGCVNDPHTFTRQLPVFASKTTTLIMRRVHSIVTDVLVYHGHFEHLTDLTILFACLETGVLFERMRFCSTMTRLPALPQVTRLVVGHACGFPSEYSCVQLAQMALSRWWPDQGEKWEGQHPISRLEILVVEHFVAKRMGKLYHFQLEACREQGMEYALFCGTYVKEEHFDFWESNADSEE
ncbi:hypothetical protein FISHEDRAFT_55921 [Fistulina hepatica ATCC 64428]|uniref:Uncharacterized protein n=1 Tax=Fistulina hepatica ATCC 64428 TaxID=1128425 RepID=A0A0D7AKL7_9AGAR|nr:hypothetical protein FISHEDRAFT_55921 [Fistulina hepatica ATCC 64428]